MGAAQPTKIKAKDAKKQQSFHRWHIDDWSVSWLFMILYDSHVFQTLQVSASCTRMSSLQQPLALQKRCHADSNPHQSAQSYTQRKASPQPTKLGGFGGYWLYVQGAFKLPWQQLSFSGSFIELENCRVCLSKKQDKANRTNMNKSHFHGSLCVDQQQHGVGPYRICLGTAMAGRYNLVISGVSPEELLQCCSC